MKIPNIFTSLRSAAQNHTLKKLALFTLYIIALLIINAHVVRFAFVTGPSMLPTLQDREFVLVRRFHYQPSAQDIVITTKNNPFHTNLVKRVIATQGQHVKITEHEIYVDNNLLSEPYLNEPAGYEPSEFTVPPDHCFLMGDNRNFSKDSRDIGCIPNQEIMGKVIRIFAPPYFSTISSSTSFLAFSSIPSLSFSFFLAFLQ